MADLEGKTMNREQIQAMFDAVDAMATQAFVGHLTPDVRFRFGSAPEVQGRQAVHDAVAGFFSAIAGLRHQITGYWAHGDTRIVRLDVTYRRRDGGVVALPCVNVFEVAGDLIRDYRIYMDVGPVLA